MALLDMAPQRIYTRVNSAAVFTDVCDAKVASEVTSEVAPLEVGEARSSLDVPLAAQQFMRGAANLVGFAQVTHELWYGVKALPQRECPTSHAHS
jgi:hypothetical protein